MSTVESKVGPQVLSDGTLAQARLGKAGEVVATDSHSRFYEANYRSKLFCASTAATGVAGQQATSLAATCALAICNPTSSGVNAVLNRLTIGYLSGTAGVCSYWWTQYKAQGNTAAAGTAVTAVAANGGSAASACTLGTGTSVTAGAPTVMLRGTGISTGPFLATTAILIAPMVDNIDGALIVPPGQAYVLFGIGAAGTSEKLFFGLEWEEVAV